jgi:hypothetical protein
MRHELVPLFRNLRYNFDKKTHASTPTMINVDDRLIVELDPPEYQLLSYLASKMNKDRVCWYGNTTICEALKWSMKRLQAAKKRLVEKGYLGVEKRFDNRAQTSNYYKILTPLVKSYTPTPIGGRGDTSKVRRAPAPKVVNEVLIPEVLANEPNTPYNPPSGDGDVESEGVFAKAKNANTGSGGQADGPDESDSHELDERIYNFANDVREAGGSIYTPLMLEKFIKYWTEAEVLTGKRPTRKRRRGLRFEAKKFFEIKTRLEDWATNNAGRMQCYLSDEAVKSITEKKDAFKKQLEQFLPRYGRDLLNAFFQHWSQPENIPDPRRLAWECKDYWDLASRLARWQSTQSSADAAKRYPSRYTRERPSIEKT